MSIFCFISFLRLIHLFQIFILAVLNLLLDNQHLKHLSSLVSVPFFLIHDMIFLVMNFNAIMDILEFKTSESYLLFLAGSLTAEGVVQRAGECEVFSPPAGAHKYQFWQK